MVCGKKKNHPMIALPEDKIHPNTPPVGGWVMPGAMVSVARNGSLAI
jgi:hypothetical protein